ncbi:MULTISPECIES: recombinase family protein [unclassified Kribbella]|uniref:recombinase family protein n=1 Tax=unclassified Kribbella TaxID=2644121 RepID=UPI00301A65E2
MTKYVALYCRISKAPNGKTEGVKAQERWGRDYASSAWPDLPVEVFADNNLSAANGGPRPEFERFREWLAAGRIAHVWAVEQSRLERREVEWFTLAAEFDAAGVSELHTNRDGIVKVRDEVAGIKAVLAAGEVRKLKQRTKDRLAEIAAEGRPHGGRTFGYRSGVDEHNKKTLLIVDSEAAALRDAADKVLSGWSLSNVAADLTRQGIRGVNGGTITYKTLNKMLTNPTVAAQRIHQGRIIGQAVWEPILDMPTWQAVRAKLSKPRAVRMSNGDTYSITEHQYGAHSTRSRRRFLLTGGLTVAPCGGPMSAQRRKVKGRRLDALYFCKTDHCAGIMADGLENHVRDELLAELDKPAFLAAVTADDDGERRKTILEALDAVERQRNELAELWAAPGELTAAEWRTARRALAEREQELQAELVAIPAPLVGIDISQVREAWPNMTLDEKREMVEMFIERVTVRPAKPGTRSFDPERVVITWRTV